MKKHKVIGWALVAFAAFYIFTAPQAAGATVTSAAGWLGDAAQSVVVFLSTVTS